MSDLLKKEKMLQKHATLSSGRLPEIDRSNIVDQIHIERYQFARDKISGGIVLDIASGIGYGANLLAADSKISKVYGVDVSQEAIREAKGLYHSSKLQFRVIDGIKLPFEDKFFDAIVSFETIEHTWCPTEFLLELNRVLKDDGMLIISTPNKRFHSHGKRRPWNPFHKVEFYPNEFKSVLSKYFCFFYFWGGQEFLDVRSADLLKYNWIEFRYYKVYHNSLFSNFIASIKKLKSAVFKKTIRPSMKGESFNHRTQVAPWQEGLEPYTIIAICCPKQL